MTYTVKQTNIIYVQLIPCVDHALYWPIITFWQGNRVTASLHAVLTYASVDLISNTWNKCSTSCKPHDSLAKYVILMYITNYCYFEYSFW